MKALFVLLHLHLIASFAYAGGSDIGRGGDSIALDFRSVATYDVAFLRENEKLLGSSVNLNELEKTIAQTQLSSQDHVFLNGFEKDAVNYSNPDRIVIGAVRWRELPLNDPRKDALVLHEYVSLMGIDDSGYAVSGKLLEFLKKSNADPVYACTLIEDPMMMPKYLDSVRVGGKGNGEGDIAGLGAQKIRVQIALAYGGDGTDVLITIYDGSIRVGMLELPRLSSFPSVIDTYAADRSGTLWQVHCSR